MYVIVGLGNPGRKYEHTRHNAGFDVIEMLSQRHSIPVTRHKCSSSVGEGVINGVRVALARPGTYMNLSGQAVVELVNWYKIGMENLLVIYDDVDLPLGRVRVRARGSAGTHNGMRSIIYLLGRDDFPRLRLGTGRPPEGWDLADYVLTGYDTPEARKIAFDEYALGADCVELFLKEGVEKAASHASQNSIKENP
ncbi:MAG: aminoacyl-tRNA hydrolase [Clostridia bacterium]|nr:aminoacyl-tRNA hydrolase [Clostridia bacterium]